MKLGYTLPKIQQYFDNLHRNKERESRDKSHVPIGGKPVLTEVFEVPLDLPRYRLGNTRTIAMQEQYIATNDLPEDYFETDHWSDRLQEIQHSILLELIKRKDMKEYFSDPNNIQTIPLVITHEGFVISGNRRLCTYRELYYNTEGGNSKYKHFERLRVVILPMMTEEEIEYVEDYFEQQPDIQDEFTWTNRALGFERRLEKHRYDIEILAEKTNVKKTEIESLINKLSVAKEYLEFIGQPKAYNQIESDEYAFNELLKARKKFKDDAAKKDIFQKLTYIALKNQSQISDRMYKNIPIIQEVLDDIQLEILNEFEDRIDENLFDYKSLDPFAGIDEEGDNSLQILGLIESPENEEALFEIVLDKVDEYKMLKAIKKKKQAVLIKVQRAHKELADAFNIADRETKKEGISEQLENIERVISQIREWLAND